MSDENCLIDSCNHEFFFNGENYLGCIECARDFDIDELNEYLYFLRGKIDELEEEIALMDDELYCSDM